jgi:hypothetical protein
VFGQIIAGLDCAKLRLEYEIEKWGPGCG